MDFTIHPHVYVIDQKGNKYTDVSQLNRENEVYKSYYYFYIVAEIKNEFCDFTYKINATFCTKKHLKNDCDCECEYRNHMGDSIAEDFYDVWNDIEKERTIIFPMEGKRTHSSKIVIKDGFITFVLVVASNSGHDTSMIVKLPYDDNMKWIMKSVAYFFTYIDFKDEE
jgi:hypothetical protein